MRATVFFSVLFGIAVTLETIKVREVDPALILRQVRAVRLLPRAYAKGPVATPSPCRTVVAFGDDDFN